MSSLSRRSLIFGASAALLSAKPSLRVGCQTNAWAIDPKNVESFYAVLATLKELGYEGFETGFGNLRSHSERPDADNNFDRIKKTGLKFFGIHVFLPKWDPQTAIAPYELLMEVAKGGRNLGAERLIISGGSTVHPLALKAKADAINRIVKDTKGMGLVICYHNHDAEFRNGQAQIDGLLRDTDPSVHFVLDAGHAMEGGGNVAEFFHKNWKRIDGIHLRDAKGGKEVPFGEGEYDYAPLAKAIQESSWRGWLLNEEERTSGEKLGEAVARPARAGIKKVFGV